MYWVLAPGALIVGIALDPCALAGTLVFLAFLRAFYFHSYLECGLLVPWVVLGALLPSSPKQSTVTGTVTLASDTHIYLACDDGSYLRVKTQEPVTPGSQIKARVAYWRVPIAPGASTPNALQLREYIRIKPGKPGYRHYLYDSIHRDLSFDAAAIASALLVGINNPSDKLREDFSQSGLSHLLAISGLHIGIVCGGLYAIARRVLLCTLGYGASIALALSLGAGLGYGMLAGASISLMRAWCMFALSGIALLYGRLTDPVRICGIVACVLLLMYPDQWRTPGFVLSFVTTAALISGNVLTSYILLAPYSLYYFFQLPLQPFIANTLAIPLLTFVVMPCTVLYAIGITLGSHLFATPLEYALNALIMITQLPLSYSLTVGMQHPIGILGWTFSVFAFFGIRHAATLIPGGILMAGSLLCSGVHEPVAMKYGSVFGLWDGCSTLWVSDNESWVVKRWADMLGAHDIKPMPTEHAEWRYLDGYTWVPKMVWFGRADRYTSPPIDALVRIWKNKPRYIPQKLGVYDITDDAAWVWLDSHKVWRANN
jgi:ComEC/Rec2-related protein